MQIRALFLMSVFFFLGVQAFTITRAATPATTIQMDKSVYFVTPNGDEIHVPAGMYTIEVTEEWLRLTPGEARDALLLQALRSSHGEHVEEPVALSIPSEQDLHHLVVLFPGGERFTATGTYSGIRSRAPTPLTLNPTTINKALAVKQLTLAGSKPSSQTAAGPSTGAQVQFAGAPPPPILVTPTAGQTFAEPTGLSFSWQPGSQRPSGVSYEVLAWKAGSTQARDRANRQQAVSLGQIPAGTLNNNSLPNRNLPDDFLGEKVHWIVKACAPNTSSPTFSLTGQPALACSESSPRELTILFLPPRLISPDGAATVQPVIQIEGYSRRATRVLFCIAKPGIPCGTSPTAESNPNAVVVERIPSGDQPYGFTWSNALTQFLGQTVHWTAAACHKNVGCIWAQPQSLNIISPPTLLGPDDFRMEETPIHTFHWSMPANQTQLITHFKFCLGIIGNNCKPPRDRIDVIKETSKTSFQMDIRDYGPQGWISGPRSWIVGACYQNSCVWPTRDAKKNIWITRTPEQPILRDPPRFVLKQASEVHLTWSKSPFASFFVVCLRDPSTDCVNGNEIIHPQIQIANPQRSTPSNYRCELHGTYPLGSVAKIWQVAACNAVWGCVWSLSANVSFATNDWKEYMGHQQLTCPRKAIPGLPYP